jgi:hypothetical protein
MDWRFRMMAKGVDNGVDTLVLTVQDDGTLYSCHPLIPLLKRLCSQED